MPINAYGVNPYNTAQPAVMPQQQSSPQHQNNPMVWVQGLEGAKGYPLAPNTVLPLWDSENQTIYIKVTDQSGIPQRLRILDYTERVEQPENQVTDYVTVAQLNDILDQKLSALAQSLQQRPNYQKKGGHNGKSTVQSAES